MARPRALLPEGVPTGHFSPYTQAVLATLAGAYRLSKRQIQQLASVCSVCRPKAVPRGDDAAAARGQDDAARRDVLRLQDDGGSGAEILRVEESLWTFARVEGVPPTNIAAERTVRHAVIWHRISGGTDSEAGSRFVERMLTVVATCRQQGRGVLDDLGGLLVSVVYAALRHPE